MLNKSGERIAWLEAPFNKNNMNTAVDINTVAGKAMNNAAPEQNSPIPFKTQSYVIIYRRTVRDK